MLVSALTRKSWTDLTRRRARAVFAVSTLAVAVASVGIFGVSPLMDRAMSREVQSSKLYDLQLSTAPIRLSRADVAALNRLPNVRALVARPWFMTKAYAGTERVKTLVVGAPRLQQQPVDRITVTSGRLGVVGSALTDVQNSRQGVWGGHTGDTLRVVSTSGAVQRLQVTGAARSMIASSVVPAGILVVYASPATVAHLTGGPEVGMIEVRLKNAGPAAAAETVSAVRGYLRAHTSFTSFSDLPVVRMSGDYPGKEFFGQLGQLLVLITLLALVSGLFLIGNTMTTLVSEQTSEIGMMKAIGGSRRRIAFAYMRTAALLGLLGTAIGVPLGIGLSNLLASYFAQTWYAITPDFGIDTRVVVAAAAIGLLGPVLASLPAIRKATAVPVVDALTVGGIAVGGDGAVDRGLRRLRLPKDAELGVRSMGRRKRRTLGTTILVALGVANLLALVALAQSVTNTGHAAYQALGYDIALGANTGSGGARPLDAKAQDLVYVRGVARAEPFLQSTVKLHGQVEDFMGVVPTGMVQPGVSQGRWLTPTDQHRGARVTVVGNDVARATGVHLGDRMTVATGAGPVSLQVVGISASPGAIQHIYVPVSTAQAALNRTGTADGYLIQTTSKAHAAIDRTTTRLEDTLTAHGYPVTGSERYVDERQNAAGNAQITNAITALGFIIVAISMIGLVNTMTANVLERTREIGILRCIGAHRRDVRRIFLSEGLAVSFLGWLVGIPLGYLIFRLFLQAVSNIMNLDLVGTFPIANLAIALVGTILLACIVMVPPLRRATRFQPGEALRYQ
jgi:putative ABC transport system permease protein